MGAFLCAMVGVENIRLGVAALCSGGRSEVLESLSLMSTSEEDGVGSGGVLFGELVESEALSSSSKDSSASGFGELQSADFQFGDDEKSLVIEDVSDDNKDFLLSLFALSVFHQFGNGDGVASGVRLVESLVHDLVEFGVGSASQEFVELDEQAVVGVRGGRLAPGPLDHASSLVKVDAHAL